MMRRNKYLIPDNSSSSPKKNPSQPTNDPNKESTSTHQKDTTSNDDDDDYRSKKKPSSMDTLNIENSTKNHTTRANTSTRKSKYSLDVASSQSGVVEIDKCSGGAGKQNERNKYMVGSSETSGKESESVKDVNKGKSVSSRSTESHNNDQLDLDLDLDIEDNDHGDWGDEQVHDEEFFVEEHHKPSIKHKGKKSASSFKEPDVILIDEEDEEGQHQQQHTSNYRHKERKEKPVVRKYSPYHGKKKDKYSIGNSSNSTEYSNNNNDEEDTWNEANEDNGNWNTQEGNDDWNDNGDWGEDNHEDADESFFRQDLSTPKKKNKSKKQYNSNLENSFDNPIDLEDDDYTDENMEAKKSRGKSLFMDKVDLVNPPKRLNVILPLTEFDPNPKIINISYEQYQEFFNTPSIGVKARHIVSWLGYNIYLTTLREGTRRSILPLDLRRVYYFIRLLETEDGKTASDGVALSNDFIKRRLSNAMSYYRKNNCDPMTKAEREALRRSSIRSKRKLV